MKLGENLKKAIIPGGIVRSGILKSLRNAHLRSMKGSEFECCLHGRREVSQR